LYAAVVAANGWALLTRLLTVGAALLAIGLTIGTAFLAIDLPIGLPALAASWLIGLAVAAPLLAVGLTHPAIDLARSLACSSAILRHVLRVGSNSCCDIGRFALNSQFRRLGFLSGKGGKAQSNSKGGERAAFQKLCKCHVWAPKLPLHHRRPLLIVFSVDFASIRCC
jgi:hypothetical protein